MKFDCGPTAEELESQWEEKRERLSNWHNWFAWYPVTVGPSDCRLFETVERRGTYYPEAYHYGGSVSAYWSWEYRAL